MATSSYNNSIKSKQKNFTSLLKSINLRLFVDELSKFKRTADMMYAEQMRHYLLLSSIIKENIRCISKNNL